MALSRRAKWWIGALLFGLVLLGLGGYVVIIGLDQADKLSSVIGLFVGLVGLALSLYGTIAARNATPSPPTRAGTGGPAEGRGGVQGNTFNGPSVIQSGDHNQQHNHFGN